jgi:predicted DNA-binding transcriptional regulator AlpA
MSEESWPEQRSLSATASKNVTLSRWVNERPLAWEQLLSAHDVVRLTRRPRWVLLSMMVLGRFPQKRRFHGRRIGWLRSDVLDWLSKHLRTERRHANSAPPFRRRVTRQTCLPLECSSACAARRSRNTCSFRMVGRKETRN